MLRILPRIVEKEHFYDVSFVFGIERAATAQMHISYSTPITVTFGLTNQQEIQFLYTCVPKVECCKTNARRIVRSFKRFYGMAIHRFITLWVYRLGPS